MDQKGISSILITLLVVILASVGVVGYFFNQPPTKPIETQPIYKAVQTSSPKSASFESTNSATPSTMASSSANISNWKTYTNNKSMFSIKYPTDYDVSENETWTVLSKISGQSDPKSGAPYNSLSIIVSGEKCIDIDPITYKEEHPIISKVNIDGISGKKWNGSSLTFADPFFGDVIVHLDKSANCYKLFFVRDPGDKIQSELFLNKILSTFKFIPSGSQ